MGWDGWDGISNTTSAKSRAPYGAKKKRKKKVNKISRTILKPANFHMAHLKRYGPKLNGNIEKVAFLKKKWGPSPL